MQYLFAFLIEFIGLFQCWTICDQFERGVVLRLGKYQRTINPGLHWLIPLGIDRALTHEVVLTARETSEQSLTTQDEHKIVVSTIVAYTLTDIKKILLEIEEAETVLENFAYGIISELVSNNSYAYLMGENFQLDYFDEMAEKAETLGMTVHSVIIVNLSEIKTLRLLIPSQSVEIA